MSQCWIKSSNITKALHNLNWFRNTGKVPVIAWAIDMPLGCRHVLIYEEGSDKIRKDPHRATHRFEFVSEDEFRDIVEEKLLS
tara:strand:- start:91684 stop:91932 length:249 start_codon:yes stop_codon:yes gene_type:complete